MTIKGVLLDVDGTLVQSNDAHARAFEKAFAEFGYTVPSAEVRPLIGMGGDKILPRFDPELNDEEGTGKELLNRRTEIFLEEVHTLQPTNGARALVERLKQDGFQVIAASSAKQEEYEELIKAAGVEDLIEAATTSSDAEESKPEGDIIHAALDKLGLQPNEVVLIGDTPFDIEAASKVGVDVIALRCGGWQDEDLQGAVAIYDDPADLLANYEQSPLKRAAA